MYTELKDIRNELLKSIEKGDKSRSKWLINDLDTYITKQNRLKSESISTIIPSVPCNHSSITTDK